MRCAWSEFLNLLPFWMRCEVDPIGKQTLLDLRIRLGNKPLLTFKNKEIALSRACDKEDISFIVNTASHFSPWAVTSVQYGYLTAPGGHRVGICGEMAPSGQSMRSVSSLCIRVARDFPGISQGIPLANHSVLIIGSPGNGKTTLLRDLIRHRSETQPGSIAVLDERGELFPFSNGSPCFPAGIHTDILTNCSKKTGVINLIRTMGPSCIAVDEITQEEDCLALLHAGWSGVTLLATAHAKSKNDLLTRPIYRPIVEKKLFDTLVILNPDKSWTTERM